MSFHSVVIQRILRTNAHIGRRVTAHHFKIFSEGTRNSLNVIDADKTLICLRNACNFIGRLAAKDARFLFVNTNPLFDEIIAQMTQTIGIKNDTTWRLGGFLTNSSSPKKFRGRNKKFSLVSVLPPDCIVIFDTERKSSVIQEAYRMQIPVVGLVDSSMPLDTFKRITYPVPANDSVEFVYLFCNLITKTILKEKKDAEKDELNARDDQVERISKKFILSYENLQAISDDTDISETRLLLDKIVVLMFNGDLISNSPTSITETFGGLTCLDLLVNQIEALNSKYGCNIPLVSVNSVNTHDVVSKILEKHPNKNIHSLIQYGEENAKTAPVNSSDGQDAKDEMDCLNLAEVFLPLSESGLLDTLFSQGKDYILILSANNLAHVVDTKILNHLIQNNIECCLEVMPKPTEPSENKLPPNKEDNQRENWKFTHSVWMTFGFVEKLMRHQTTQKNLSVSKLFDQQCKLSVPKFRYLPFDSTTNLFQLQSDLYTIVDGAIIRNTARESPADPSIQFGPEFEKFDGFKKRFKSIPCIVGLDSLKVTGDVWFGSGITLKGKVSIHAKPHMKIIIPDDTLLENTVITSQADIESMFH